MGVVAMVKKAVGGDDVASIEAELARLNRRGSVLATEIEDLEAREADLEDADELGAAIVATRAARNKLRKIDASIAETRTRLAAARAAERAKLCGELLAKYRALAAVLVAQARAVQATLVQVIQAREALRAAGFGEYQSLPIPPAIGGAMLVAPDLVDAFEAALAPRPVAHAPPRHVPPSNAPRQRLPHEPVPHGGLAAASVRSPAIGPRRAPVRAAKKQGEQLVTILRDGIDFPGREGGLLAGDVVSVAPLVAEGLMRNGAADLAEEACAATSSTDQSEIKEAAE